MPMAKPHARETLDTYLPGGLSGLDASNYSITAFVERVARQRGRPIELKAISMPGVLWGAWIADPNADYIFFEHNAPRVHQGDIILRQLARMLLGLPTLAVDNMAPLLASPKALAFAVAQPQRLYTANPEAEHRVAALVDGIRAELVRRVGLEALFRDDGGLAGLMQKSLEA